MCETSRCQLTWRTVKRRRRHSDRASCDIGEGARASWMVFSQPATTSSRPRINKIRMKALRTHSFPSRALRAASVNPILIPRHDWSTHRLPLHARSTQYRAGREGDVHLRDLVIRHRLDLSEGGVRQLRLRVEDIGAGAQA